MPTRSPTHRVRIPVETGVGAAIGGAGAGAAVGAFAGPVGTAVGAAVGAVAGGYAGKAVGEVIDPTTDDTWLRDNFAARPTCGKATHSRNISPPTAMAAWPNHGTAPKGSRPSKGTSKRTGISAKAGQRCPGVMPAMRSRIRTSVRPRSAARDVPEVVDDLDDEDGMME